MSWYRMKKTPNQIFHKYFQELWDYRSNNMNTLTITMHRVIIHLSIIDYYLQHDLYQSFKRINDDWEYVNKNMQRHDRYVDYRMKKCSEIIESMVLLNKLTGG
jgi:hypothetical protein